MHRKLMERKMQVMLLLVSAIFLLLICRLFYMQLIQNDKYSTMARENRMRLTTIMAPRGEVFDRYGVKLVGNEPVYTVLLDNLAGDASEVIPRLASIMGISSAE
ncbi:MAG: penicillin-binding protein 2, partial [Peptococcaceae bacterium]|nr:penicillin-binding protein 2 [Peptococcaceae bacterium]